MSTYDQFVQFGVDSFGLERTLRLLQSLAHILLSLPLSPHLPISVATADLLTLRSTLNLTRRVIRTFRFLASFSAMQALYSSSTLSLETWLDVSKLTFLGFYGLLETATLPDMAGVEVFGVEWDRKINLEAQRFWFIALVCGVLGGTLRFFALEAEGAVPATGAGYSATADEDTKGEKVVGKDEKEELKAEAEPMGKDSKSGKAAAEQRKRSDEKKRAVVRKVATDAVDLVLPVSILGWVEFDPAVVGAAMFVSTVLSGYDVWKGVGVQTRNASKA